MKRLLIALGTAALLFTSCTGHSGPTYSSAEEVATALGCSNFRTESPEFYAADAGSCTYAGHFTGIQWFKDSGSRDSWVSAPDFGTVSVTGANWAVECDSKSDCVAIQKKVGGTMN